MAQTVRMIGDALHKRPLTPGYILFYILFSPEIWRILIGILAAWLLAPVIVSPDMAQSARVMLWIMIAVIGYTICGVPARWITHMLVKWIVGDKSPYPKHPSGKKQGR
ncbi:MAG: hypothetical protein WA151_01460 [Desulfatirhabdiaceae bacterium]